LVSIGSAPRDRRYASFILPIRNRMRQHTYASLLEQFLLYLNQPVAKKREDELKKLAWVVERLLLWLFGDLQRLYGSKVATSKDVQILATLAWEGADEDIVKEGIGDLDFFMRRLWMNQAAYQSDLSAFNLSLQLHLLSELDQQTKLYKFFAKQARMPAQTYCELALLRWSRSGEQPWVNQGYVESLMPSYSEEILRTFLNSITHSLSEFQSAAQARVICADEWSQPFYFYKSPCLWHSGASIPLGRPNLRRHFEGFLFDWVEQSDDIQIRQHFDKQVENHVGQILRSCGAVLWAEDQICSELRLEKKQVVDFLVLDEVHVVLIEVKNKSLTHAVPASSNSYPIKSSLKPTVIKAISQLDSTEAAIRKKQELCSRSIIRLIITFNDLWISSAESLLDEKPADNSWLVSLQDLSYLVQIAESKKISIGQILTKFVAKQTNRATSSLTLGKYLEDEFQIKQVLPIYLRDRAEAVLATVSEKLKHLE
jgi:hypothetical protein